MALVLVHNRSSDAKQNVSLLKQRIETTTSLFWNVPWSQVITGVDVTSEGEVLLAKLNIKSSDFWGSWFFNDQLLLYHE
jgi:hypothetical protein